MPLLSEELTPREIAQQELDQEANKKGVKLLKEKLRQLKQARTIVANLEREVDDLEEAIDQGNV